MGSRPKPKPQGLMQNNSTQGTAVFAIQGDVMGSDATEPPPNKAEPGAAGTVTDVYFTLSKSV